MSLNKPILKLRDWIDINDLDWDMLSLNKNAISIIEENPAKINWAYLSYNKNAISLLKENPDKIKWTKFTLNPSIFKK